VTDDRHILKELGLWRPCLQRWTQSVGWYLFFLILKYWCGLRFEGTQMLAGLKQCVFAPTHASHLDFWAVLQGVPPALRTRTYVAAAKDHFYRYPVRRVVINLFSYHNFSLDRERASHVEYRRLCRILTSGKSLLMFPQGTRTRDGSLLPFKPMLVMLALDCEVPIVPVAVIGSFEAMPAGRFWPRRKMIRVRFGKPLFPKRPADLKKLSKISKKLNNELMQKIAALYHGKTE